MAERNTYHPSNLQDLASAMYSNPTRIKRFRELIPEGLTNTSIEKRESEPFLFHLVLTFRLGVDLVKLSFPWVANPSRKKLDWIPEIYSNSQIPEEDVSNLVKRVTDKVNSMEQRTKYRAAV